MVDAFHCQQAQAAHELGIHIDYNCGPAQLKGGCFYCQDRVRLGTFGREGLFFLDVLSTLVSKAVGSCKRLRERA